jgi:hypothetical protein
LRREATHELGVAPRKPTETKQASGNKSRSPATDSWAVTVAAIMPHLAVDAASYPGSRCTGTGSRGRNRPAFIGRVESRQRASEKPWFYVHIEGLKKPRAEVILGIEIVGGTVGEGANLCALRKSAFDVAVLKSLSVRSASIAR